MKQLVNHKWLLPGLVLLMAASLALLMIAGCSSNAVAPDQPNPQDPKLHWLEEVAKADEVYYGPPIILEADEDALVVGVEGGSLGFTVADVSVEIQVPVGAVSSEVEIVVDASVIKTPLGPIYIYDFGPEGLVFNKPIKFYQPVPPSQRFAFLYYFNPDSRRWELQQVVGVKDGIAVFDIYHFSKYGIS